MSHRKYAPPPGLYICHICGWDFPTDNKRRIEFDPHYQPGRTRTEPRQAIARADGVRFICDVCYDKALFVIGKHPAIGTPLERLVHDALWPECRDPDDVRRPPQPSRREEAVAAMEKFLGGFGQ